MLTLSFDGYFLFYFKAVTRGSRISVTSWMWGKLLLPTVLKQFKDCVTIRNKIGASSRIWIYLFSFSDCHCYTWSFDWCAGYSCLCYLFICCLFFVVCFTRLLLAPNLISSFNRKSLPCSESLFIFCPGWGWWWSYTTELFRNTTVPSPDCLF